MKTGNFPLLNGYIWQKEKRLREIITVFHVWNKKVLGFLQQNTVFDHKRSENGTHFINTLSAELFTPSITDDTDIDRSFLEIGSQTDCCRIILQKEFLLRL